MSDDKKEVPAKRMLLSINAFTGLIKGEASLRPAPNMVPAYSASGQDVWVPRTLARAHGPGIVLSAVGARCGRVFFADHESWGTVANTAAWRISPTWDPAFVHYVLGREGFWIRGGSAQPYVQVGPSLAQPVALIPLQKQQQIVHFLDQETRRIDRLIAKQERLIELLAEKRQAVITQFLTKGLDPAAPTKSSGIPWVPASPFHWTASRIKWTRPQQESGTSVNGADVPAGLGDIGVLKTGAVSKGYFVASANKTVVPDDVDRVTCPVRGGTLIVNRANTPDLVGSTGMPESDMPALFLSDKLWQIEFKEANTRFMYWWTKTDVYRSQIQFRRVGASSSMQNLSYSDFLTVDLAIPPVNEQDEIARYLDDRTKQIDVLASQAKRAISLLHERRSALISAAVTGKIDVREGAA